MLVLDEKNIVFNLNASDRDDCICKLAALMQRNGYIGADYADCVIERENTYPTGLPTEDVLVAIPHANKGTVYQTGIGIGVLKQPVGFYNMADPEELLQVELVFMLANSDPDKQLKDLSKLMNCFSEDGVLLAIQQASTPGEIIQIIRGIEA